MEFWLKTAGAAGLDDLRLADFPVVGRGVKTLRSFQENEKILSIPGDALWTIEHAYAEPLLGPALRSLQPSLSVDDTLIVYILFVRSQDRSEDGRRHHVAALPTSYSSSIFFTEDDLAICAGTSLYAITKQLERQIEDDHRDLVMRLFVQHRDLFPLDRFTIEDYKWALCTVWSRAMDFQLADGKSLRLLAPFADMLNHSPEVKQCHAYDATSGSLSILAGRDYEPGDQVNIFYGRIPNNRLLRLYGFVIPDNPHDSYDLVLSTHPDAPLFEQKEKLWALSGLASAATITLTLADPLPAKVLQYLRIQRLSESDLAAVTPQQLGTTDQSFSISNEVEVLKFLSDSLGVHLESFAIQVETLEEQLAKGMHQAGGNAWAAAHVSIGEQKILRLARRLAEDKLAAIESGSGSGTSSSLALTRCANCGKDSVPLMLCARCKSVMYCGRACQVGHYKEHKVVCRTIMQSKAAS